MGRMMGVVSSHRILSHHASQGDSEVGWLLKVDGGMMDDRGAGLAGQGAWASFRGRHSGGLMVMVCQCGGDLMGDSVLR